MKAPIHPLLSLFVSEVSWPSKRQPVQSKQTFLGLYALDTSSNADWNGL